MHKLLSPHHASVLDEFVLRARRACNVARDGASVLLSFMDEGEVYGLTALMLPLQGLDSEFLLDFYAVDPQTDARFQRLMAAFTSPEGGFVAAHFKGPIIHLGWKDPIVQMGRPCGMIRLLAIRLEKATLAARATSG